MKPFELFLPLLLVGLVFTAQLAYAPGGAAPIVFDFSGVINAITSGDQSVKNAVDDSKATLNSNLNVLSGTVDGLKQGLFNLFRDAAKNAVKSFNSEMLKFTQQLLSTNPDPESMYGLWQSITLVISSFYLFVFLIIGLKFLISGHSAEGREKAKDWLKKLRSMMH